MNKLVIQVAVLLTFIISVAEASINLQVQVNFSDATSSNIAVTDPDISVFSSNTVLNNSSSSVLTIVEHREGIGFLFDRIGFNFSDVLNASGDAFSGSVIVDLPTAAPLTNADLDGLPIIWGLSSGRGPVVGTSTAIPEPKSAVFLSFIALFAAILSRRVGS